MNELLAHRRLPRGEFISEFIYPGEVVDGYESATTIWNVLAKSGRSVFASFEGESSVHELQAYLARFGISGVMAALPHMQLVYWTPHGWERGWCFQVPMDEARFLTCNIAHEQGCTLYLLRPDLRLAELAKILSNAQGDAMSCLQSLLGWDDSILFLAADEYYSVTTHRLGIRHSSGGPEPLSLANAGEFTIDRVYPGTAIDWDGCFDEIWDIVAGEPHALFACLACNGPHDEIVVNADLEEVLRGLPNRKVDYCTVAGIDASWCFELPVAGAREHTRSLLASGICAAFFVDPRMTIDQFAAIHAANRTLPISCLRRLLRAPDSIIFANGMREWIEVTRHLQSSPRDGS